MCALIMSGLGQVSSCRIKMGLCHDLSSQVHFAIFNASSIWVYNVLYLVVGRCGTVARAKECVNLADCIYLNKIATTCHNCMSCGRMNVF